jgi:hypothetical protein
VGAATVVSGIRAEHLEAVMVEDMKPSGLEIAPRTVRHPERVEGYSDFTLRNTGFSSSKSLVP